MVAGKRVSEQEKQYILKNKDTLPYSFIAKELGRLYPEDNQGSRDRQTVRKWARIVKAEEQTNGTMRN